jgi:cell division protein FtsN
MKKLENGNTVLGILLGMLGGIALTSGLAWFIFKSPAPYVAKEQVVAKNLTLPSGAIEELFAVQRKTGNPDAAITVGGYRVRTNNRHEIFVTPLAQSGVTPASEMQVKHTGTAGGGDKQRFEFYEILSKRHYPNVQEQEPVVENQGRAKITIYPAEKSVTKVPAVVPTPKPVSAVAASAVHNSKPFVSPKNAPPTSQVTSSPTLRPTIVAPPKPTVAAPPSGEKKMVYLEVDFFPSFTDAASLQEKLLGKGLSVQLKEEKVLGKHAGYKVYTGPYLDSKNLADAKSKLKKMGFNPAEK